MKAKHLHNIVLFFVELVLPLFQLVMLVGIMPQLVFFIDHSLTKAALLYFLLWPTLLDFLIISVMLLIENIIKGIKYLWKMKF